MLDGLNKKERVILHCDCNSFFASCEAIDHPEYNKVPMAVAGDPKARKGVILAKNELAKKYNIQTAESVYQALKKCPNLLLVAPHHDKYQKISKEINDIYNQYTDRVEPFSVDESWLDVTDSMHLFGDGKDIADTLRKRIKEEIGITISVGVSYNKTFAKMGSDYKKPDATTIITKDNYKDIIWPLPIENMMFVGKALAHYYKERGINTIGDLAILSKDYIQRISDKNGLSIWKAANGLDDSEVALFGEYTDPKSISHSFTFDHNLTKDEEIKRELMIIADMVGSRLRQLGLFASTISIQVKDENLKIKQKQKKCTDYTNSTKEIYHTSYDLVKTIWYQGMQIRMLTVAVSGFSNQGSLQTNLFATNNNDETQEQIEETIDNIRSKFGDKVISFARAIKKD